MSKIVLKIKRKIRIFIEENFKCWGAEMETDLPPEFLITKHAEEKFKERANCKPDKIKKITVKAWNSKLTVPHLFEYKKKNVLGYKTGIYRYHNGFVYIFTTQYNNKLGYTQKKLVTMYDPKRKNICLKQS